MSQGLMLSILRCQHAHDHQVVNFFHLVVVFASVKQLRKCPSDTIIWVLQRGATAEDMWEGRPPRVLLGYMPYLLHLLTFTSHWFLNFSILPGLIILSFL